MINLKTFKEIAAKYLHLCMIEVQPQDVVEICERAIAAEELAEARRRGAEHLANDLVDADKQIRELKAQLAEMQKQEPAGVTSYMPAAEGFTVVVFESAKVPVNSNVYVKPVQLSASMPSNEEHLRAIFESFYNNSFLQPDGQGGYHRTCEGCTIDNDWSEWKRCWLACKEGVKAFTPQPKLAVWYGPMPESNGKSNWTAILHRANDPLGYDGHTIDRSEYPDRVRYEADRVRYLIGELEEMPDILAYDADKHSGYVEPPPLESIIQDTIEHGTGFAITDTSGIQHVKQEDVLAKPFAEIDYWQGNKLYCTVLEHVENLDIGDKLYLQPPDNIQHITEQDALEILKSYYRWSYLQNWSADGDQYLNDEGRTLLAKLNENREPKLQTHKKSHNLKHLELIKAKQYSFMNCALCSHSVNVAVLIRSTNCSVHICESCAQAVSGEFK